MPIFIENDYTYTQEISHGCISSFEEVFIADGSVIEYEVPKVLLDIGDQALFCFYSPGREVIAGDLLFVRNWLRENVSSYLSMPFLMMDISQFIDDKELFVSAVTSAASKIRASNRSKAPIWRASIARSGNYPLYKQIGRQRLPDPIADLSYVKDKVRFELGEATYRSWIHPIALHDYSDFVVTLSAPTKFMRDWISNNYLDRIRALWPSELKGINIVISQNKLNFSHPDQEDILPISPEAEDLGASLDPRFTFANFVVGKPSEFAYSAARRIADADTVSFNPLFLYGGVGLGKTHLMQAIAWHIREHYPMRRVLYLSAEKFMYRFIRALRNQDTMSFREHFRSVSVLMIDDVQFIAGKDATQKEFLHIFNALIDRGCQMVISADKPPSDMEGMEHRLRSRLNSGLVADIHATTYELRLGILQSKAEQLGALVPVKVLEFLAHKLDSNVRELEGALNRVVAHAQLIGRAITVESTQEVLHDLLRAANRRITIEEIQKCVAEHFNIKLVEMSSARRSRQVARPRQIAMYLSKQLTTRSLPEIGRKFGGRDHTSVMHAVRKVEELRAADSNFDMDVEFFIRMLRGAVH